MSISTRRLMRAPSSTVGVGRLYLSPSSGSYSNGSTLIVNIREDSGTTAVNTVQANLTYPAARLQFQSIDTASGAFTTTIESSGGAGVVRLGVGLLAGSATGDQLVGTVTFNIIGTGSANIAFDIGSGIARASDSVDICGQKDGSSYTIN